MKFSDYNIEVNTYGREEQRVTCPVCTPWRKKKNLKDLAVNIKNQSWICHHCGWKGSLNDQKKVNKIMMNIPKKIYKKPEKIESFDMPEKPLKWFSYRGISQDTVARCGITYELEWIPQTNKQENCIVFNYFIKGELVNKKYRTGKKHFRLAKDARLVFYAPLGIEEHVYGDNLYITEGEMDALTLIELGIKNTISSPNGAPPENTDIENLDFSYFDSLKEIAPNYKRVYLIMDNDYVGARFRDEIARRIGIERCYYAEYPEGCKDINDVLVKHGKEKALDVVNNCKPYPINGKYDVDQLYGQVYNLWRNGFEAGKPTGWESLNNIYTVRQKEFTVITGIPSHGKSSWLDHLIVNLAKNFKWAFGIFSPENFPFERHIAKLCEIYIGKPFDTGYNGAMSEDELADAVQWCNNYFHFLLPGDEQDQTLDNILSLAKASIFKDGIKGLVIDPWNEIEHEVGRDSETVYISKALSKIRKFCRVGNIHTWLVAHPTKLAKGKDGKYPKPNLYDISGSAHFYNKADNGIVVYRDFDDNSTEVCVPKVRFKEIGKPGKRKLFYDVANGRYHEN